MLPPDPRHHQVPPLPPRAEGLRRGLLRGSAQHTLEDQVLALIKDSSSVILTFLINRSSFFTVVPPFIVSYLIFDWAEAEHNRFE